MTYLELVAEVAKDCGLPRETVTSVLRSLISTVRLRVSDGRVILRGFGVFYAVVPKKGALFGGSREPTGRPVIRFKEARHGKPSR